MHTRSGTSPLFVATKNSLGAIFTFIACAALAQTPDQLGGDNDFTKSPDDGLQFAAAETAPVSGAVKVNRTVPKVSRPRSGLEFSAAPTADEISRACVFAVPLVPVGGEPSADENAALVVALTGYAKRTGPDDFGSLTRFLDQHPRSPWRAGLLADLGLEYYNTAHYSLALETWEEAWSIGQEATDAKGKFLADRVVCELAGLYSRLGRMTELEALLKSVEERVFLGGASERINIAREALWDMKNQPQVSFRCGPLALQSILRSLDPQAPVETEILNSASTTNGFSLARVAELSRRVGLNYQMAYRGVGELARSGSVSSLTNSLTRELADFIVPSVVHWKAGHYAAIVRQEGDEYLIEDPTFARTVWATKESLESETSGYFLIPPGDLPSGWRRVDEREAKTIWGKGTPLNSDPNQYAWNNHQTGSCPLEGHGMAVSSVHLMLANLQVRDTPVGYTPPVGPPVYFTVRYNQRDYLQPESDVDKLLGPKWTHDWNEFLQPAGADMKYIVGGGGARIFTGFNAATQTYAPNQYDQTLLHSLGANTYEMIWPDGSKKIFGPDSGPLGIRLSQVLDPAGNAVTLTYDGSSRLVAITDAIGQVTTISYEHPTDPDLITKVTDPFGRSATFQYASLGVPLPNSNPGCTNFPLYVNTLFLTKVTDVLGLESQFVYTQVGMAPTNNICGTTNGFVPLFNDTLQSMTTPYGTTSFSYANGTNANNTLFRRVTTQFPDGSSDRVEYNQSDVLGIPNSDPAASVPVGMVAYNQYLYGRNTYYWSRNANASSGGDHTKAKIYHWLHTEDLSACSGILASTKEPLEGRVWYDYAGGNGSIVGGSDRPTHVGRVLEDGQTQLYTQAYNEFGKITNSVDPLGRTFSFLYASNNVDLLEIRQTRAANNELLFRATYNAQHRPLTTVDAAGQTNTYTYNARGQQLTAGNSKGETTTYTYDTNGYLIAVDGPLPGSSDTVTITHDSLGRVQTMTGVSGYTLTFDHDILDRLTQITHPDSTFEQFTYDRLDLVAFRDRAGRQTLFEYDPMRQLEKKTDPLGRVTRFDWCRCGQLRSLTDPMGRTTTWLTDVQGRPTAKQYADGSKATYIYESASSRLHLAVDEKEQITQFAWNQDDTLRSLTYNNTMIPTPGVSFTYDPDYQRIVSMTDGTGTTRYSYNPITGTPNLGAGALASVDGPLPNDTITYSYDKLGRPVHRAINGVDLARSFDAGGRLIEATNALGDFAYTYDNSSARLASKSFPNGQVTELNYGNNLQGLMLQRITHKVGAAPVSEFLYSHDVPKGRVTTWSQQAGASAPDLFNFNYDSVNQLLSASVTNSGTLVATYAYTYDPVGNRLSEQVGASNNAATYNGLNEISTTTAFGSARSNEWDALDRLVAVTFGNQRTEFTYDGLSRMVGIRNIVNGSEMSYRRFVWCGGRICEERDFAGVVTKRFFPQGMQVVSGPNAGDYFYTRDHLGSIRELTDNNGNVRARYAYDPYGRRTKLMGDVDADFGFAGMFWSPEAHLAITHFRVYDPELGRWLSRDPLPGAEVEQGPNLYAYAGNEPISKADPLGLCTGSTLCACVRSPAQARACTEAGIGAVGPRAAAAAGAAVGAGGAVAAGGGAAVGEVTAVVGETCAFAAEEATVVEVFPGAAEVVFPEVAAFPGIEVEEGVVLQGAELEDWLLAEGEIGGEMQPLSVMGTSRFGPNALELMSESSAFEELFRAANQHLPIALRLDLAARFAAEKMGFSIYRWLP